MAFTSILRRSASSLAPLATRLVRGQWNYHAAAFTAINNSSVASFSPLVPNPRYYAKLIKDIPIYWPFELEDEPGIPTVRLTRSLDSEEIVVEAGMPHLVTGKGEADDGNKWCIPLTVTIKDDPEIDPLTYEFSCSAYPDEIVIEGLVLTNLVNEDDPVETYMGPDFLEAPITQSE